MLEDDYLEADSETGKLTSRTIEIINEANKQLEAEGVFKDLLEKISSNGVSKENLAASLHRR